MSVAPADEPLTALDEAHTTTHSGRCNRRDLAASEICECFEGRPEMEKDVVCGMQVDPVKAAGSSEYKGKTYYFCSKGSQDEVRRESRPVLQIVPALRLYGHAVVDVASGVMPMPRLR